MKKILIISHAMELGGAETSLIGLLDSIDYTRYSVDLFLLRHEGELLSAIPADVNLLPEIPAYTVLARPMKETLKEGHILLTAARLFGKISATCYARLHHHKESTVGLEYSHKYTCPFMPKINPSVKYDMVVSYLTPHYFAAEKVQAEKRLAWIHTDYTKIDINNSSELKMWSKMDHIASISDAVSESFTVTFPSLKEKLVLIENILPKKLIESRSYEPCSFDGNDINILSVGRFSHAKNFDNVPEIAKMIRDGGLNIKWYLIGYGTDEELIRSKISEFGMEDHVIILGKKDNPYPYIKACDLYVQPSRYEGKCVAVREAQMFGKPVAITDYATSSSQLEDGIDGVIVPMDNTACAEGIAALLNDKEKLEALRKACMERDYTNANEVEKLYELMEG